MQPDYYVDLDHFVDRDRMLVFRRPDLLWLELELVNCRVSADGTALQRIQAANLSSVDVHLPFQHLLEEPAGDGCNLRGCPRDRAPAHLPAGGATGCPHR